MADFSSGIGGYVRYCDDFILLDDDRGKLTEMMHAVPEFLAGLRLRVHEERLGGSPSKTGQVFVGFRTWATHRNIKAENKRRFLRRFRLMKRAFAAGAIDAATIHQRLMSWCGHAGQTYSTPLLRKMSRDIEFVDAEFHAFRSPAPDD